MLHRRLPASTDHLAPCALSRTQQRALSGNLDVLQLLVGHVVWLLLAASCEVEPGCPVLGLIPFGLAFGNLPSNPCSDITAGWGRAERIDVVGAGRLSYLVDGGDLG